MKVGENVNEVKVSRKSHGILKTREKSSNILGIQIAFLFTGKPLLPKLKAVYHYGMIIFNCTGTSSSQGSLSEIREKSRK